LRPVWNGGREDRGIEKKRQEKSRGYNGKKEDSKNIENVHKVVFGS
jgi:hypothetical protein